MSERVDTPEAFLALRLRVRDLERQVEEAKSAAARTCYQGGAAAGEVLAKMQAENTRLTDKAQRAEADRDHAQLRWREAKEENARLRDCGASRSFQCGKCTACLTVNAERRDAENTRLRSDARALASALGLAADALDAAADNLPVANDGPRKAARCAAADTRIAAMHGGAAERWAASDNAAFRQPCSVANCEHNGGNLPHRQPPRGSK